MRYFLAGIFALAAFVNIAKYLEGYGVPLASLFIKGLRGKKPAKKSERMLLLVKGVMCILISIAFLFFV